MRRMDETRAAWFRETLLAERQRLLEEIADAEPEAPGQMTYGSQAAMASEVFAQQRDLALRDRSTRQLDAVDAALVRLDEGTFGICRSLRPSDLRGAPRGAPVGGPVHRVPAAGGSLNRGG